MNILFTADIHIKLGQKNVPITWARNRFNLFIEQFAEMQNQADLIIIGGDVFDRLPTMDEVELYFDFIESFKKPTLIYPGNHEMLKKDTTFLTYLKKSTHRLNPLVSMIDDYYENIGFDIDIIPYNKLKEFEKIPKEFGGKILCTHVRGEIPPHVKPEVDLSLFDRWNVVLAGDLHSYENSQRNILYPGSPYTTSFHRNAVDTGAILLNAETLEHVWLKFSLPQLIKKTIEAGEPTPATDFDHTIYEVTGDMQELGDLEDNELIERKVIKRETDAALILDPEMTLTEEVKEYLTYILELPESTIEAVLKEMQNHAEKFEQH
jgi:hypothetical protein